MLAGMLYELRRSLRVFTQSPAFALAAVAALALGIGVNTAIFSVVNAVLLRPLPFPDPDRIVFFMSTDSEGSGSAASPAKFQHFVKQGDVVGSVSAFQIGVVNDTGGEVPEQLRSGRVSRDFFALFGARTNLGRTFSAEEDRPGGPKVVVLSQRLWKDRFGSDPAVTGRVLALGGEPHTIIGVLDEFELEGFGSASPQVWLPFQLDPNTSDQAHYFQVAGRVREGVSLSQARARVKQSRQAFEERFPGALGDQTAGFDLQPIGEVLVRRVRQSLLVLAGAVAFVLLIACANVANLMLARAGSRRREVAIRTALGGSRARIAGQVLSESVVLSFAGGALGLLLGTVGVRALLAIDTAGLPRIAADGSFAALDWRVLSFTLALCLGTGLLFGLFPALQVSRPDLAAALGEGDRRGGGGARQSRLRSALVATEVALAVTLLVASALMIRTAIALGRVDPGFDASHVLTMRTSMTGPRFLTAAGVERVVTEGVDRLMALPGVESASATCCVPLEGGYGLPFLIVGRPAEGPYHGGGQWMTASPGYFEVFRIPLRRGRVFDRRDTGETTPVVVINEAMARQFWPDGDPLSDRLVIGRGVMKEFDEEPERQIVGIVGDTRDGGLNSEPGPAMYVPQAQLPDAANALNVGIGPMGWVVRTAVAPASLSGPVQETLRQVTGLPVSDVKTMQDVVARSTSRERLNMWLMTVFGTAALLLAAIGIYGLIAYSVQQRTRELGIRIALGARAGEVWRMVVGQGMRLAVLGAVIGLIAAALLARVLESFLFGVTARDPLVFAAVPLLLLLIALAAVSLPAFRASRVDPSQALRQE